MQLTHISFDTDSTTCVVDNCSNTHVWVHRKHFTNSTFRSLDTSSSSGVYTVDGLSSCPQGIGSVPLTWRDNEGTTCSYILTDVLLFPSSPVNILSPRKFAEELNDLTNTWIKSGYECSEFVWENGSHDLTFKHNENGLPELTVNLGFTSFMTYQRNNVGTESMYPTCLSILPSCDDQHDLSIGTKVRYVRDDRRESGTMTSISPLRDEDPTTYEILTDDGRIILTTKEFVFNEYDQDLSKIPSIQDIKNKISSLTEEEIRCLLLSRKHSPLEKEFMEWHNRLSHLSFKEMKNLSKSGILPRSFHRISISNILCPSCKFGKMKRLSWRTISRPKTIRRITDNKHGKRVSIDQVVSHQPGLVPQQEGKDGRNRIVGGTVFIDHFTNFTYTHLQTSLDHIKTLEAKDSFELIAYQRGIRIHSYHTDNGRFAEKSFKDAVRESSQMITLSGVGSHHQNGIA